MCVFTVCGIHIRTYTHKYILINIHIIMHIAHKQILGLDPTTDLAKIKTQYRQKVFQTHPDKGGSATEFREVFAAHCKINKDIGDWNKRNPGVSGQKIL